MSSNRALLEVIALDAEDAVAARSGGADRLELVTDMAADGLTPPGGGGGGGRPGRAHPPRGVGTRPPRENDRG
ncbi:hypothetical protein ACWGI0_14205, partial [Streptomyces sp. NPDC054802]